ncbi:MAG: prepilin-type N-terminal cleavage/methylation domain-containing protein [Nitrospirae bacterium]|nr:prepilin-type N-terminal cleavage/methylation domain-containing protein [Nitrospirota bacterium]
MKNSANKISMSDKGFTLLELMVSFLIIGIVILIIAGALRLSLNIVDKGEAKIDSLERTRTSLKIVTAQIQSQFPLAFEEDGEKKIYFQGESKTIQLATNYSIWGGQRGYVLVRYKVETDESGKEMLSASENIVGIDNIKETTLFKSLDKIYFEYFFKDPLKEEGEWIEKWEDSFKLPEKIRLHLEAKGKDFFMIIPVRATGAVTK